jgi:hypothetical protein
MISGGSSAERTDKDFLPIINIFRIRLVFLWCPILGTRRQTMATSFCEAVNFVYDVFGKELLNAPDIQEWVGAEGYAHGYYDTGSLEEATVRGVLYCVSLEDEWEEWEPATATCDSYL